MLYWTVISIVCAFSALGEGISITGRKNYLKTSAPISCCSSPTKLNLFAALRPNRHADFKLAPVYSEKKTASTFHDCIAEQYNASDVNRLREEREKINNFKVPSRFDKRKLLWFDKAHENSENYLNKLLRVRGDDSESSMKIKRQSCDNWPCCESCPPPSCPKPCNPKPPCPKPCCQKPCCKKPYCPTPCGQKKTCRPPKPWCPKPSYPWPPPCPRPPPCSKPCGPGPHCPELPCCPKPSYPPPPNCPKPCATPPPCVRPCYPKPSCPKWGKKKSKGCTRLTFREKKKLIDLIKVKNNKNKKKRLDEIKVDEDLDLGKRIQTLTRRLAIDREANSTGYSLTEADADFREKNRVGRNRVRRQVQRFRFNSNFFSNPDNFQDPNFDGIPVNYSPSNFGRFQNYQLWRDYIRNLYSRSNSLLSRLGPRYFNYRSYPDDSYYSGFNNFTYFNSDPNLSPSLKKKKRKRRFFENIRKNAQDKKKMDESEKPSKSLKPTLESQTNPLEVEEGENANFSAAMETIKNPEMLPIDYDEYDEERNYEYDEDNGLLNDKQYETVLERPALNNYNYKQPFSLPLKTPLKRFDISKHSPFENFYYSPYKYLETRNALTQYMHKHRSRDWPRIDRSIATGRRKRCGCCCSCSMPRKCWRSAPLLCVPYIRRGQDELLKYLIRNMQKLLGKPFPQKVDIFEQTKYKPCCKNEKPFEYDCDDIIPECDCQPPCQVPCQPPCQYPSPPPGPCQQPCPPFPCPYPTCQPIYCRSFPAQFPSREENIPSEFPNSSDQSPLTLASSNKFHSPFAVDPKTTPKPPPPCPNCFQYPTMSYYQTTQPSSYSSPLVGFSASQPPHQSPAPVHPSTAHSAMQAPVAPRPPQSAPKNSEYFSYESFPLNDRTETATTAYIFSQTFSENQPNESPFPANRRFVKMNQNFGQYVKNPGRRMHNEMPMPPPGPALHSPCEENFLADQTMRRKYKQFSPQNFYPPYYRNKQPYRKFKGTYSTFYDNRQEFNRDTPEFSMFNFYRSLKHPKKFKGKTKIGMPVWSYLPEYMPIYDYEMYDKYPLYRGRNLPNFPVSWVYGRDYSRKYKKQTPIAFKNIDNRDSKRQKRSADYTWPQILENYGDDYLDYPNYSDFLPEEKPNLINQQSPSSQWRQVRKAREKSSTFPMYDWFSDLAMALTDTNLIEPTIASGTSSKNDQTTSSDSSDSGLESSTAATTTLPSTLQSSVITTESTTSNKSENSKKDVTPRNKKVKNSKNQSKSPNKSTDRSTAAKTTLGTSSTESSDKKSDNADRSETEDEAPSPTTLKAALLAKGPKKQMARPAPKVYAKVYPDIIWNDTGPNEFSGEQGTTSASKPLIAEKNTLQQTSSTPDVRLQLFALCEGYLEVLKLVKNQNRDEIDPNLSRYCENIISQSFNLPEQQSKSKFQPFETTARLPTIDKLPTSSSAIKSDAKALYNNQDLVKTLTHHEKLTEFINEKYIPESHIQDFENPSSKNLNRNSRKKKLNKKLFKDLQAIFRETKKPADALSVLSNNFDMLKNEETDWKASLVDAEENQLKLYNQTETSNGLIATTTSEIPVTSPKSNSSSTSVSQVSGPIALKNDGQSEGAAAGPTSLVKHTDFSVYAKNYGYESNGEVKKDEIPWKIESDKNTQSNSPQNVSVLASLVASSTEAHAKHDDIRAATGATYFSGDMPDSRSDEDEDYDDTTESESASESLQPKNSISTVPVTKAQQQIFSTSITFSHATLLDANNQVKSTSSSDAGKCLETSTQKHHQKKHKIHVAKDKLQEYSIEFLNYAVYILPIMFTVLFFFCCTCCFYVLCKSSRHHKRSRKNRSQRKILEWSSGEWDSDSEEKREKREKHVRNSKGKRCTKTIDCKSKSFLKFLKTKRNGDKIDVTSLPYIAVKSCGEGKDSNDSAEESAEEGEIEEKKRKRSKENFQCDTVDRKEILALLEDIKKIETEHMEDKKQPQKPICVQYMTKEPENISETISKSVNYHPSRAAEIETDPAAVHDVSPWCCIHDRHSLLPKPGTAVAAAAVATHIREVPEDLGESEKFLPCECARFFQKSSDFVKRSGKPSPLFKIFRDASQNTAYLEKEMDLFKSGNENYLFNKYRSVSTDTSDERLPRKIKKIRHKDADAGGKMCAYYTTSAPEGAVAVVAAGSAAAPPYRTSLTANDETFENNRSKNPRLRDFGVLCRL